VKKKTLSVLCLVCLLFVFSCSDDETDPLPPATDSFIVAFDTMGGSFIKPQLVAKGALVTQPAAPVREGWTFAGWYRDREGTTAWVYSTDTISAETTIFAKWTGGPVSGDLSVTFDTLGGSGIGTQFVAAGGLVTQPVMYPDKTGSVFVGWYKDADGTTPWNFSSDTVQTATTVYAKWAPSPLTCTTNSGIEISDCLTTVTGHLNIPNYISGRPVVRIGKYAFEGCDKLTSVTLPSFVHTIAEAGFAGAGLYSIVVPEPVTELSVWAFADCTVLTNIVLPPGLTSIRNMALSGCTSLKAVLIPETVTTIDAYAFDRCSSLTNLVLPAGLSKIESRLFKDCTQLRSVTMPTNYRSIGIEAFKNCTLLASIVIPASVTNISLGAFEKCSSLTNVQLPAGLTVISSTVFADCIKLESVTMPPDCKTIGLQAFRGCTALTTFDVPASVTVIMNTAFQGCTGLTTLTMRPVTAPSLGTTPFLNVSGCTLHYPFGGSGYDISPWSDTSIFSTASGDL